CRSTVSTGKPGASRRPAAPRPAQQLMIRRSPAIRTYVCCEALRQASCGTRIAAMNDRSEPASDLSLAQSALLVLRTFLGIVFFTNGLAKVFGFHTVTIGPWKTVLLNRGDALGIQSGNSASAPGFLHDLGVLVVTYWDVFQWLLTFAELAIGIGLIL